MQDNIRRFLVVFVVFVILSGIYWTLTRGRVTPAGDSRPVSRPADITTDSSGGQDMARPKPVETRFVDVTFQDGENFQFKAAVPLEIRKNSQSSAVEQIRLKSEAVQEIVAKIPEPEPSPEARPAEAKADRQGRVTRIVRGIPRQTVDRQAVLKQIQAALKADPSGNPISVLVARKPVAGEVTFEDKLRELGFTYPLGEGETIHDDEHRTDEGRNENLRVAAEKIDGLILQPGEEFSFNRVVGERSSRRGFKPAGVISNGRVIPGLGGGICQVSTSLFNAALLASLKIVERHNHSIYDGIPYAQRGRDAAVAWGYKDFRFVNSLPFPVAIGCINGPGYVKAVIYGSKKPFDQVEIATRNEKVIPFSIQRKTASRKNAGAKTPRVVRKGVTGYTIETFRLVTRGASTTEERLHKDHYLMYPEIIESRN